MILAHLKERTRPHHERVEQRLPVLRDDLAAGEYRDLLARFHGFYAPLEARLCAVRGWDGVAVRPADRLKTPLLRRDLAVLGVNADALPPCPALPDVDTLARALGAMYVLEGSTLGGRLIERHLARVLGLSPARGCAFFASYGDRVGPMWKAFGAAVTAYAAAHPGDEDEMVDAAAQTFDRLDAWLAAEVAA